MRVTTEKLLELAQKEAESRPGVISGYVIGSTAAGDPLFGGTADVDLILIHEFEPMLTREIVPLSDEVHLDIYHHSKRLYEQPRDLRLDPWLGPAMCEPVFLFDPSHFFEWAQASVRGQFHRPDNVHARAEAFLDLARLSLRETETEQRWLSAFLHASLEAVNAVASLDGFPAAGRRVMPQLRAKLAAVGHEEIYGEFLQLLGAAGIQDSDLLEWISSWKADFVRVSPEFGDPELAPVRRDYYISGFEAIIDDGSPVEMLWPFLTIWDRTLRAIPETGERQRQWSGVLNKLGLSPDDASQRKKDLDGLLDIIEGVLELWAERVGA